MTDRKQRKLTRSAPRARIICRQAVGKWELVVKSEQGFVVQGEVDDEAAGPSSEFRPTDFKSVAIVEDEAGGAGGTDERIRLYTDKPMVFQLGKDWQGDGRKVGGVGIGHFVVIVPANWRPLDAPPVEPEPCVDDCFRAHYFHRNREDTHMVNGFKENGEDGREHAVSSSVIKLYGKRVYDKSQDGELFVRKPPTLKATGMAWARVGEEGNPTGWAETFPLDGKQSLGDVLDGREGWFFVRVYADGSGVEADSVQFRYLADLREIRVAGNSYGPDTLLMPSPNGHRTANVEVACCEGSEVEVAASSGASELEVQGRTVVCPASPDLNEVCCRVKGPRGEADIVVELPRVWWGLASCGSAPQSWRDTPQTVTKQEFREQAAEGNRWLIDVPNAIRQVQLGFDDGASYPAYKNGERRRCAVPLEHFLYNSQIARRLFRDEAIVADLAGVALELMRIAADPPPRIVDFVVSPDRVACGDMAVLAWKVEDCDDVAVLLTCSESAPLSTEASGRRELRVDRRTVVKLTLSAPGMQEVCEQRVIEVEALQPMATGQPVPYVKTGSGWRRGKGFSGGELSAVPVPAGPFLRADRRRRSVHAVNVKSLERWVNEQH